MIYIVPNDACLPNRTDLNLEDITDKMITVFREQRL